MATQKPISELDFAQIKNQLKTYLQGQDQFKDYDFAGSNMNILLDLLAYNTFQNNFYANMAVNEMFLDSAQLRESVVSHAKALNYVPRSVSSARSVLDLEISPPAGVNPAFIVIPPKTQIIGRCGTQSFNFYTLASSIVYPSNGTYTVSGLEVFEGTWVTEYFEVTGDDVERFILSNADINVDTIRLYVKADSSATDKTEFVRATTVFGVKTTDNVFYVQGAEDEKYELVFGRDKFGTQPITNNVLVVEYLVSSGKEANGVTTFVSQTGIGGYPTTVYSATKSSGGADKESLESVRYFAPRSIQVQDRAVTEQDYEVLLKTKYPEIQAISVYGGEELSPPRYGRVVIAVDVSDAEGVSDNNKAKYAAYLQGKTPVGIEPLVISPEFMHIQLSIKVYYDPKVTAYGPGDLTSIVTTAIESYNDTYLNDFKSTFRPSTLSRDIDAADASIVSSDIVVIPFIPLIPTVGLNNSFDVSFKNALVPNRQLTSSTVITTHEAAISSSTFTYAGKTCQFIDDGSGAIHIIRQRGTTFIYLKKNVGSVNYATGRVIIRNVLVDGYLGSELKLYGRTVSSTFTSPKDRILSIRPSAIYESDIALDIVGV